MVFRSAVECNKRKRLLLNSLNGKVIVDLERRRKVKLTTSLYINFKKIRRSKN